MVTLIAGTVVVTSFISDGLPSAFLELEATLL